MKLPLILSLFFVLSLCFVVLDSKKIDPYKVLGVEKNASQREIQKAFHKLSLQYHPDKNKDKGAQEKFSEINNAYDILSDEEKRKNYDMYGDEKGNPGFDAGHPGDQGGFSYFTSGGPGGNTFSFRPGDWQSAGGQGGSQSFSFSFGGAGGQNPFSFFGMDDMFGNLFQGGQFGGFKSSAGGFKSSTGGFKSSGGPNYGSKSSTKSTRAISSKVFKKEIANQGMTWLLLFHTPTMKDFKYYESLLGDVGNALQGVLKVGNVNCENEPSLCKELGTYPRKAPRLFTYTADDSLVEYHGDVIAKDLKNFCQENLPGFSKRVDLKSFGYSPDPGRGLPIVMLLSAQKNTPVIWRALSGLFHKRINFYDALVHDATDPTVKELGVNSLPAIVGWLKNGEKLVLKSGISVKDKKSAIQELSSLLNDFEKKNKKLPSHTGKSEVDSGSRQIPLLTALNLDTVCGEDVPVCIIGAFRSSRDRGNLESILSKMWQKSLSRKHSSSGGSGSLISYAVLDASKQAAFLKAFDTSGFKSMDKLLIAYKPRKGKFSVYANEVTEEAVESFIGSVLNGDVHFNKTRQKPKLL